MNTHKTENCLCTADFTAYMVLTGLIFYAYREKMCAYTQCASLSVSMAALSCTDISQTELEKQKWR